MMINYLDELELWLREHDIEKKDICLMGSASMAAAGIRENHDLEFVIRPSVRKRKGLLDRKLPRYHKEYREHLDLWKNQFLPIGITDEKLFQKQLFLSAEGFQVVLLDLEKDYKEYLGREKDREDLERLKLREEPVIYRRRMGERCLGKVFLAAEKAALGIRKRLR